MVGRSTRSPNFTVSPFSSMKEMSAGTWDPSFSLMPTSRVGSWGRASACEPARATAHRQTNTIMSVWPDRLKAPSWSGPSGHNLGKIDWDFWASCPDSQSTASTVKSAPTCVKRESARCMPGKFFTPSGISRQELQHLVGTRHRPLTREFSANIDGRPAVLPGKLVFRVRRDPRDDTRIVGWTKNYHPIGQEDTLQRGRHRLDVIRSAFS